MPSMAWRLVCIFNEVMNGHFRGMSSHHECSLEDRGSIPTRIYGSTCELWLLVLRKVYIHEANLKWALALDRIEERCKCVWRKASGRYPVSFCLVHINAERNIRGYNVQ